jgi:hypothetical protein
MEVTPFVGNPFVHYSFNAAVSAHAAGVDCSGFVSRCLKLPSVYSAYPFYNRGRAYLVLGKSDEAKADFTTAADPKFKQPGARKLALNALTEFP